MSEKESKLTVSVSEKLESLLVDALEDVKNDIDEIVEHIEKIKEKIEDPNKKMALEMYAEYYREAIKVKGITRDRQLKIINIIKDRLRVKEAANEGKSPFAWNVKPQDMLKILDEIEVLKNAKKDNE